VFDNIVLEQMDAKQLYYLQPHMQTAAIGENAASMEANLASLRAEFDKVRPNMATMKDLSSRTFPYRREFMSQHQSGASLNLYPWLKIPKLVSLNYMPIDLVNSLWQWKSFFHKPGISAS
jgi:hypothetical protein